MNSILLPKFSGWVETPMTHIVRLEGRGNYTAFILQDGQQLVYSKTISLFETRLEFPFVRVHKSTIINLLYLSESVQKDNKDLFMTDGFRVEVSRRRRGHVKTWMKQYLDTQLAV